MQKVIEAQSSDLFDVLAYVAFAMAPHTRAERAAMAKTEVHGQFNDKQLGGVNYPDRSATTILAGGSGE